MRIKRRYATVLALAAAGALAVTGVALAGMAADGNVSSFTVKFNPNKVPKKKYKAGKLNFATSTTFANPGNRPQGGYTERLQVWFAKDIKVNPGAVPKCDPSKISGNLTMQQAMSQCGKSNVGTGTLQAYDANDPAHPYQGCGLLFNGKPQGGNPTILVFVRLQIGPNSTIDCSNPSSNTNGNVTVLLTGILRQASGKYSVQDDIPIPPAAQTFPLIADSFKIGKGNYVSARCHSSNKIWNYKSVHTYSDGDTATDTVKQKCTPKG